MQRRHSLPRRPGGQRPDAERPAVQGGDAGEGILVMSAVTTDAGRVPALEAEIERLRDEHAVALALVADVRFACGDYGQRMQPELLEYLRELAADAARYRWLRRKFGIMAAVDGAQFCALNMPRPAYIAPDAAAELDAAIDAAKGGA